MERYGLHVAKDYLKHGIPKDTQLTALAFFLSSPLVWSPRKTTEKECQLFRSTLEACPNLSAEQIVVHGCYLMNPASDRLDVRRKTDTLFVNELQVCDALGVGKYVFHPGTYSGKDTQEGLQMTVDLIQLGLRETKNVQILVENMTKSHTLCQTWQELDWVMKHVNDRRVGCCMDTAHCWGAGECKSMYMDTLLDDFSRIVGMDHLGAIHLNDSKAEYGSNKDLHEDLLKGKLPASFWQTFPFDERVKKIPTIMETPSNCHPVLKEILRRGAFSEEKEEVAKPSWLEEYVPAGYKDLLCSDLRTFVRLESDSYEKERVFPPKEKIFAMFSYCPYLKIWQQMMGHELTWFPPLKKVVQTIETTLPVLKQYPDEFECIVPFAGTGIASYVFHHSFGIYTQSSDKKEDNLWQWFKSFNLSFVKKDSWRWIRNLSLKKRTILLVSYPPYIQGGDLTDLLLLRDIQMRGFLHAVIYIGKNGNGSLGFHDELQQKMILQKQEEIRNEEFLKIYVNPQVLVDEDPRSSGIPDSRRGSLSPLRSGLVSESEEIPAQQRREVHPTSSVSLTKSMNDTALLPLKEQRSSH